MKKKDSDPEVVSGSNGDVNRLAETFPKTETHSPYKPEEMWIDPELIHKGGAVKRLFTTVPIRKPNKHEFFRVHCGPEYWKAMAFIALRRDEIYQVMPHIVPHLDPADYFFAYLCLAVNRQGQPFLWPLKISTDERKNNWNDSALTVAKSAVDNWIKLKSRQEEGSGGGYYEGEIALANLPEPTWPAMTQQELYNLAFKGGRIIDSFEHPALQKLSGAI